uniref:Uncharacterized protein n=1 Tax=Cucumis melo TaxID=3656 RepID=A0A9I9EGD3_CUCME
MLRPVRPTSRSCRNLSLSLNRQCRTGVIVYDCLLLMAMCITFFIQVLPQSIGAMKPYLRQFIDV